MQIDFSTIIAQVNSSQNTTMVKHKYLIIKTLCELALNCNLYTPYENTCKHLRLRACSAIDIDPSGITIVIKQIIGQGRFKVAKLGFDVTTQSICARTTETENSQNEIQIQKLFTGSLIAHFVNHFVHNNTNSQCAAALALR